MSDVERWPTDPTFRKFAALVADGVMYFRNLGFGEIALYGERCRCPEGAALFMRVGVSGSAFPTVDAFCETIEPPKKGRRRAQFQLMDHALLFAEGFDGEERTPTKSSSVRAAYRLGQEYRRRYVGR